MQRQGTAQRPVVGGWRMALPALLALVLLLQPFACLLHCAQLDLLPQFGAAHLYHILCGTSDHVGGEEIVAAAPAPSATVGAFTLVPAYWPGMLSTWTLALGVFVFVLRMLQYVFSRPTAFVALPATPPPR